MIYDIYHTHHTLYDIYIYIYDIAYTNLYINNYKYLYK